MLTALVASTKLLCVQPGQYCHGESVEEYTFWQVTSCTGQINLLLFVGQEMPREVTVLLGLEGNVRCGAAMAMQHKLCSIA